MGSRDIVRKAWQITQVHLKKLIWYGVVPAFFSIVVSSGYIAYQYNAFRTSVMFSDNTKSHIFDTARAVFSIITGHATISIVILVIAILSVLSYVVLPPILNGALINALMKIKNYEKIDGSVEIGVRRFFPMFEFALLSGAFGIKTLFTESSFILRWWGENVFFVALPVLLFIAAVGLIVSFLFTYAEFFIVLHDKPLMNAIMESTILVISNLRKTFLILMLIVLISLRIILNALLVLIVPMLVVFVMNYFTSIVLSTIIFVILGIVGIIIFLASSYVLGLFHVFTTAVWVLTFSLLSEKTNPAIKDEDLGGGVYKEESPKEA